jgi:hypothetical protein
MNARNDESSKGSSLSRRDFLAKSGSVAAFTIVPRHVLGQGYQAPSEMLNVAAIGVGGRGAQVLEGIAVPDVPIERPVRSSTGQPLTPEQMAAMAARRRAAQ